VRRRIAAGQIAAYRDIKGRLRITPHLASVPEEPAGAETPSVPLVARLMGELREVRDQLERAAQQNQTLQNELQSASLALEYSREEIASMWRILSSRRLQAEPAGKQRAPGSGEAVERIRAQITTVRQLASRRRKFPWALVS
jgi:hypothetical protein